MQYEYKQSGLQAATELLPLELLKQYLRVESSTQDAKITDYIKAAIAEFEKQTGYLLRSGTLELKFNFEDRIDFEKRHDYSYVDVWDDYKYQFKNKSYLAPISGNFASQKPTLMSFYTYNRTNPELVTLTADELTMLPDDFFLVFQRRTLEFTLKLYESNANSLLTSKKYSPYSLLPTTLNVAITAEPIRDDIKQACIRIASMLFEYPDQPVKYMEDQLVVSTMSFYNSAVGL